MRRATEAVCPLTPFLWDAERNDVVTDPGALPGHVSDIRMQLRDLDLPATLAFDLLDKSGTLLKDHSQFPLYRCPLSRRQFELLRYGLIVDDTERLVLVSVPRRCADDGVRIADEYAAVFRDDLQKCPTASHPLHTEHVLVVYQMPATAEKTEADEPQDVEVPEPLFRLVFRNEVHNNASLDPDMQRVFPSFRLRAVYVSSRRYRVALMEGDEIVSRLQEAQTAVPPDAEAVTAIRQELVALVQRSGLFELHRSWIKVLTSLGGSGSLSPSSRNGGPANRSMDGAVVVSSGTQPSSTQQVTLRSTLVNSSAPLVASLVRSSGQRTTDAETPNTQETGKLLSTIVDQTEIPIFVPYIFNMSRQERRIRIYHRRRPLIRAFRQEELGIQYVAVPDDDLAKRQVLPEGAGRAVGAGDSKQVRVPCWAEPEVCVAPCVRVVMTVQSRDDTATEDGAGGIAPPEIIDNELFVPPPTARELEAFEQRMSGHVLRAWVLKALVRSEYAGAHSLLLEVDLTLLQSVCTDLMSAELDSDEREFMHFCGYDAAEPVDVMHFSMASIVVSTVEDYLQHNGAIWRVILSLPEENNTSGGRSAELCAHLLHHLFESKLCAEEKDRGRRAARRPQLLTDFVFGEEESSTAA